VRYLSRFVHGVCISAIAGCSGSVPDDGADADGIPTWTIDAEPRSRIGVEDGDPRYLFDRVADVRLLADGGVVVADDGASTIRVFSSDGTHLASMGGPGEGPGEFRWTGHVSVLHPDTILVYDGSLFRVTRFLTDGTLIGTLPVRPEDGSPEAYLGTYSNGDAAIAWIVPGLRDPVQAIPDVMKLGRFDGDGALVTVLVTTEGMRRLGPGPVPFSPFLYAWLVRDSVFYTDGREPSLTVLDEEGLHARTITIPLAAPDLDAAWSTLRVELAARDQEQRLDAFPAGARTEPVPAVARVVLDSGERFWLKHYEPRTDSYLVGGGSRAGGGQWTVVSIDGRIQAEVEVPDGFVPLDVSERFVAGVHRDELGVERVLVLDLGK
jgi:hypothetical protein